MPFITVIPPDSASGKLQDVYSEISRSRGSIANVLQITSLHPELTEAHLDLYMTLMYGRGGLSRGERELVGTAVSRFNACEYCVMHHSEAYARYEKDAAKVAAVVKDPLAAPLSARERALLQYAYKLTREPGKVTQGDVDALRKAGVEDRDVLACAAITAYFNWVNRIVLGCGVELEKRDERVYKY